MADQLLDQVQETFEGQIDFEGQRLADTLTTCILGVTGLVSFLVGYILQDIHLSLYTGLAGTALAFAVIVPPWPFFNQHPLKWLPGGSSPTAKVGIVVDGQKIS